jgi:hypothetical protein
MDLIIMTNLKSSWAMKWKDVFLRMERKKSSKNIGKWLKITNTKPAGAAGARTKGGSYMTAEYDRILKTIREAFIAGDTRKEKTWRRKLAKWQAEYGAYAPIR